MRSAGLQTPACRHYQSVFYLVSVAEDRRFELLRGCPPTRFPIMLPGVHQRSPAFTTVRGLREHEHADAGERRRTGVNETKTETTVMELRPAGPCLRGLEPHALARNLSPKVQSLASAQLQQPWAATTRPGLARHSCWPDQWPLDSRSRFLIVASGRPSGPRCAGPLPGRLVPPAPPICLACLGGCPLPSSHLIRDGPSAT